MGGGGGERRIDRRDLTSFEIAIVLGASARFVTWCDMVARRGPSEAPSGRRPLLTVSDVVPFLDSTDSLSAALPPPARGEGPPSSPVLRPAPRAQTASIRLAAATHRENCLQPALPRLASTLP